MCVYVCAWQVEDRFQEELASDKGKYSRLLSEKGSMEGAYEERIVAFEERQAKEVCTRTLCVYVR